MNIILRSGFGLLGALVAAAVLAADPPRPTPPAKSPASKTPEVKPAPAKPAPPSAAAETPKAKSIDAMKVPAGGILVIVKEIKDALAPTGVWLTVERYNELLNELEALKRQLKPGKPETPSWCKLTNGTVEGESARLQVQFDFETKRANTLVGFGCQRAWLRSASLDGQLPLFANAAPEDGIVIEVGKGVHQLNLELALPVINRGGKSGERGIDLGLPGCSITNLEGFTFPTAAGEVRINGRVQKTRVLDGQHSRLEAPVSLGQASRLEILWKGPAPAPAKGKPLLVADNSKVTVRIDEKTVTTDVEMTLQVQRGEARQWRILLPPQVVPELKEPLPQDERIESRILPTPKEPWLTLHLKQPQPTTEPLHVSFQYMQPRRGTHIPIGPIAVLDAFRQRGTVLVKVPSEMRLRFQPHGDLKERELTEEMRRDRIVAAFSYWNLAVPANPAQAAAALMDVEAETIKGAIETRVEHSLQQVEGGFQVVTRVEATPVRMGVEQLELQVPADYARRFDRERGATPANLVEPDVIFDDRRQVAIVRLVDKQTSPFAVTLTALYPVPAGEKSLTAELPRPIQTLDRGGQVSVTLAEDKALVARPNEPDAPPPGSRRFTWKHERAPTRVELEWHDFQPEFPVDASADITLVGAYARVRQRIGFQFPGTPPSFVTLTIPPGLAEHIKMVEGGTLGTDGLAKLERPAPRSAIVLDYTTPVQAAGVRDPKRPREPGQEPVFSIPLVRPAQGTRTETKVRIWGAAGVQLQPLDGNAWDRLPTEVVRDHDSLPSLVLRSGNPRAALILTQERLANSPLAPVVIERALIQVGPALPETSGRAGADEGYQYRARFLLTRLSTRQLDLDLPAPISSLNLEVWLDGKRVPQIQALDANEKPTENGAILRLGIEPDLYLKPVVLDLRYLIPPGRKGGNSTFHSTFYPPVPRGNAFLGRVRWQVNTASGWLPVYLGGGFRSEQRWEWHGGLLSPRPALSGADLDRWVTDASGDDNGDDVSSGLVCARADLEPLSVYQAPQQGWLLACSLVFLVIGLGLSFAALPRGLLWGAVTLLVVALAAVAVSWPSMLPLIVYGCEPGVVVLILVVAAQWMLHKHYRRQIVFLPGFTRTQASSASRRDGSAARPREPSTVDVHRKKESSIQ